MKANFITEKYLLFKAKNKDPQAFSQVYDLYVAKIYRFIFFKVNKAEDAQDLTSEVFLKTWQYIIDGKEIQNLRALLYTIAKNLVIDHYRKSSQKEVSLEQDFLEQQEMPLAADGLNQVEQLDQQIVLDTVADKLRELKDEYREALILRFVDQLSIKEMAAVMDKKSGAVRVILYRALNALKKLMEADSSKK
jgi:RNA polymerase sigma-70 factor (ECF subfamily)